jgi:uncharacterized protein YidB (DUF937 family)
MSILNTIKSILGGNGKNQSEIVSAIMNLIGGQSGGLNGLISQFNSKGLGDVVSSWVGTGKNLPITADQIQKALGDDTINSLTAKLGMDKNALTDQLSKLFPKVMDKLTPQGKVPEGDILTQGMDLLGGLFGKK